MIQMSSVDHCFRVRKGMSPDVNDPIHVRDLSGRP
jgi:hypothetical protein